MAIYVDDDTRLLVQGATGATGRTLIPHLLEYGTDVVAGVAPGRGGASVADVPVYGTVDAAVDHQDANASFVTVPARFVKGATLEAIDAGIDTIVVIAEDVPVRDTLMITAYADAHDVTLIGPNTLGILSPGKTAASLTAMGNGWYTPGDVGVVTRSGTLSSEVANALTQQGIGQSTVFSVGGDPYVGTTPADAFRAFDDDPETAVIAYVGEIGGSFERHAAAACTEIDTPVCATVVGRNAPPGKQMGHAGAIRGDDEDKVETLRAAGARVVDSPFRLPDSIESLLT
jgi:succinyl-CoA synthetase alpha subunit